MMPKRGELMASCWHRYYFNDWMVPLLFDYDEYEQAGGCRLYVKCTCGQDPCERVAARFPRDRNDLDYGF